MVDRVLVDAPLILGGTFCLTVAAWLALRRAVARDRPCLHRFCPQCGFDIAARLAGRDPIPMARPVSVGVESLRAAASGVLPSDLLRGGWIRTVQPAADAAGRPVFSDSANARSYTIWGAGNRAFEGTRRWESFFDALRAVLRERYGRVTVQKWNRDPARTHEEVVAVAAEAERRIGLGGGYRKRSLLS